MNGRRSVTFTVDSTGAFAGSNTAPCSFRGRLTPRATVRVFDATLEPTSGACIFPPGVSGIVHFDEAARELRLMFPYDAGGSDLYYIVGRP